jgi:hypothetical protein
MVYHGIYISLVRVKELEIEVSKQGGEDKVCLSVCQTVDSNSSVICSTKIAKWTGNKSEDETRHAYFIPIQPLALLLKTTNYFSNSLLFSTCIPLSGLNSFGFSKMLSL